MIVWTTLPVPMRPKSAREKKAAGEFFVSSRRTKQYNSLRRTLKLALEVRQRACFVLRCGRSQQALSTASDHLLCSENPLRQRLCATK